MSICNLYYIIFDNICVFCVQWTLACQDCGQKSIWSECKARKIVDQWYSCQASGSKRHVSPSPKLQAVEGLAKYVLCMLETTIFWVASIMILAMCLQRFCRGVPADVLARLQHRSQEGKQRRPKKEVGQARRWRQHLLEVPKRRKPHQKQKDQKTRRKRRKERKRAQRYCQRPYCSI